MLQAEVAGFPVECMNLDAIHLEAAHSEFGCNHPYGSRVSNHNNRMFRFANLPVFGKVPIAKFEFSFYNYSFKGTM